MAEAEDLEALDVGDEGDGEGFAEGEGEGEDDVSWLALPAAVCSNSVADQCLPGLR
jgi:hypothetical protein